MEETAQLTTKQRLVLSKLASSEAFCQQFYFTGGTALSAFYLKHRESEDLDFFTEKDFDSRLLTTKMTDWGRELGFSFTTTGGGVVLTFWLTFNDNAEPLKVDFVRTSSRRLKKGENFEGLTVDSLTDIAVNKLFAATQRAQIKDFVDLYFLLQRFTFWDLLAGVKAKYLVELDLASTAGDFLKVNSFEYLPKMYKPLDLTVLKAFFNDKAREIGLMATTA